MKRKRQNPIGDYLGATVGLSTTGSIIEGIGGPVQAKASQGISNFSNQLPLIGTLGGLTMVTQATKKLNKRRK